MMTVTSTDPSWPPLSFSRLLVIATGSVSAAYLPADLSWLRTTYPDLSVTVILTPSARQFVTPTALSLITGQEIHIDQWDDDATTAVHVAWNKWAQAILVYPSTLHYLARLALGLADSPSLLTIHCANVPVIVAPALPPGGWQSTVTATHVAAINERPHCQVIPPVPVRSWTTGDNEGWGCAPFAAALGQLELSSRGLPSTAAPTDARENDQ
ncbi:flavoprotein [Natronoglycomyces albus]|uniref:Flavoprotein n=1 Tax=Natronoglycomyces albus TaxID=2811108 RepID=A0A895XNK4_9ACTN|nr:flavoprotein [Natronoglycomyces albus]QSB04076.1 flavoprotein [Natronoglycomyces albus]